ncbi:MAG: GAD-like domain-containing protein [Rudaea sp.]
MDDDFDFFLGNLPPLPESREVPADLRERLAGRLPNRLFDYWAQQGWRGYGGGRVWTVDPLEYADLLALWLRDTQLEGSDDYHVVARSAFGNLRVWGTHTGARLNIASSVGYIFIDSDAAEFVRKGQADFALGVFFGCMTPANTDLNDEQGRPLFKRALQKYGPLAHDEMYGFEPSLVLGGSKDLANLRRVKILEHMEFIAQLRPSRVLDLKRHFAGA